MEFNTLVSILIPAIISSLVTLIGVYSSRAVQKSTARKIDIEASKIESDSKVETTEKLIQAAGSLVDQYSTALEKFKQERSEYIERILTIENSMNAVKERVHEQQDKIEFLLKTNQELATIGVALFKGVEVLIRQLRDANIEPRWKPSKEILAKLSTLEEFNTNGYRKD